MNSNQFFILMIICIITHIVRTVYELLKHKKLLKPNKLTFVIIFTDMAVLWISWILLCSHDIYRVELPILIRFLGALLTMTGLFTFLTALFTIKTLESYDGDLITKGIYSKVRHPMYLGFILWLTGFPVYFGALFSILLAFLFIANVLFWRHLEEKELEERFPSYTDYKKTTFF
jgi:protein-S-isoprenylcysteine O-methyltransferase Ste14